MPSLLAVLDTSATRWGNGVSPRSHEAEQRDPGHEALAARRIDQGSGRELADQGGDRAQGQHEADIDLGPFPRGQIHRHERPEARLSIGKKEIQNYTIDFGKCNWCRLCEEACPTPKKS